MDFSSLDLHPDLQRGIADAAYVICTPVQEQVIAQAASGRDLYVQSQTGTGKTAAFLVVIFQRLLTDPALKERKALVMVPTRELAVQVEEEAKLLGRYLPFSVGSFYGGVGYGTQHKLLRNDCDILIGTPGRVLDLNAGGEMNLMEISFLVIDEADRMFDMGFYPDLRRLISVVSSPDKRQTMLFSATLNNYVKNLAWEYTREPLEIEIESEHVTVDEIQQVLYHVHSANKMRLLLGIFEREKPESAIIFSNTKRYTEVIAQRLRRNGIKCEYLSGDLPQKKRLAIIEDLKSGKNNILVATDIAARGLDIEGLALVVNYDLPVDAENYVHRIGRTARAGKTGKAISMASEQDVYELADIEKYIAAKIPSEVATESLFAEDKSGGTARTDREDRRGERGPGRRHNVRSHGTGNSGYGSNHDNGGNTGGRPLPGAEGGHRQPGKRSDPRRKDADRPERTTPQVNLSKMTLEERTAYYNEKYNGSAPVAKVQGAADTPNTETRSKRKRKRNGRRTQGQQGAQNQQAQSSPVPASGYKNGSTFSHRPVSKRVDKGAVKGQATPPKPAETAGAAKKGILSKLAALLFKGKKD
jgi:ATP-dependent RNA helicase RhlB